MPQACSKCGWTDIDTDPARGDAVCTSCGTVLEDQIIVSEVQYQENAAGGASVIGQFVSNDGTRAQSFRGAYGHGFSTEDSRKLTLENGFKRLKEMGGQLRMHQSSIETAFGFFKLAVNNRFTRGRKMEYVLASCLYLVCRVDPGGSEDLELMLIDFSDLIQVNVHILGRTFVQLAAELCQNIRIVDPIIYIRRFANQLHFGDRINKVVESATRLVARMKRDWMHTGRRPAGLCGAALLISSRMHNFNRTIDQIIKVVKVCESTVRKRLLEFDSTPSAQLTIEEFDNVDLEEEQDPPCFTEGKRKAKLAQLKDEIPDKMVKEMSKFEENINKSLKRRSTKSGIGEEVTDVDVAVKVIDEETVKQAAGEDWKPGEWEGLESTDAETGGVLADEDSQDSTELTKEIVADVDMEAKLRNAAKEIEDERGKSKEEPDTDIGENEDKKKILTKSEDGELDLAGIDDEEIDKLIMTEEEAAHKAKWFNLEFGDYMEVVKEREEKRRIKEEAAAKRKEKNPKAKKKKKKGGYNLETELAECMEILEKNIREKKLSDKINYNVLSALDATGPNESQTNGPSDETEEVIQDNPTDRKPQMINRFRKSSISEPRSVRKKPTNKRVHIEEPAQEIPAKKVSVVLEEASDKEPVVIEAASNGPVIIQEDTDLLPYEELAAAEDGAEDEEEEEDFEEDEAEDKILSARQLLSQDVSAYEEEEDYYY